MSDRRKRDIGNKRAAKKHANLCGCWHCEKASTKKREKTQRVNNAELKKILKHFGLEE